MTARPRIQVIDGATRSAASPHGVVSLIEDTLEGLGHEVEWRTLRLEALELPLLRHIPSGSQPQAPVNAAVQTVRDQARWADGFVLVTREYHGSMSGSFKTWFDHLYLELAGKLAGVVAVTGGGCGDMSITAVKTCFSWCHGFTLPFHAAARAEDFDPSGVLLDGRTRDRVLRIVHDIVRYAPPIRATFEAARKQGGGVEAGFAAHHADDEPDV